MANVKSNAIGTQYKTSSIILNETRLGFEDNCEFVGVVNHDYEELFTNEGVKGLPTGGTVSVREQGFRTPQSGRTTTIKPYEQDYTAVSVLEADMKNDSFEVSSTEFVLDRNKATDSTHYQTAASFATAANIECYKRLKLGTPMMIGSDSTDVVNYDLISQIPMKALELSISNIDAHLFMNTKSYNSVATSINTGGIFDQELNRKANRYIVGEYAGVNIIQSSSLITQAQAAGTAGGSTIAFGSIVSTDSFRSAIINLTGSTSGKTLLAGDRLQFQTTKLLNPRSRLITTQPLELVVQAEVTADSSGDFNNVSVVCGILPLATSEMFANVAVAPTAGEDVYVLKSHRLDFWVPKPGFTFGSVTLPDLSVLELAQWAKSGNSKNMQVNQIRYQKGQETAPFNIRTVFDMDYTTRSAIMVMDFQPFYKTFQRQNFAIITELPTTAEAAYRIRSNVEVEAERARKAQKSAINAEMSAAIRAAVEDALAAERAAVAAEVTKKSSEKSKAGE